MSVRPSGGILAVTVTEDVNVCPPGSMRAYIRKHHGAFRWVVPEPKGHPQAPSFWSLRGRAHTYEEALEAGKNRLREVYGRDA